MADITKEDIEKLVKALKEAREEVTGLKGDFIKLVKEEKRAVGVAKQYQEEQAKMAKLMEELTKKEAEKAAMEKQAAKDNRELTERELEKVKELTEQIEALTAATKNYGETLEQFIEKNYAKLFEETSRSVASGFQRMLGIVDRSNEGLGLFFDTMKNGRTLTEGFVNAFATWKQAVLQTTHQVLKLTNILGTFKKATMEAVFMFDQQISAFEKQTGLVDEYNSMIMDSYFSLKDYGVQVENITSAISSLTDKLIGYSLSSEQTREELTKFTALQERVGISVDTTSQFLSTMIDTLHMTEQGAMATQRSIEQMAVELNISLNSAVSDFNALAPELIKYSDDMVRVFAEASGIAKALGADVKDLVTTMAQFDTFEGAARSVGRFNAILGGPYLNTMQLMRANEAERTELMIEGIKQTNRSWESMGKFERQAVGVALGIKDLSMIQKIWNADISDMNRLLAEANMTQAENEERARKTASILEKLQAIMANFMIIVEPLIEAFHWLTDAFVKLITLGGLLKDNQLAIAAVMGTVLLGVGKLAGGLGGVLAPLKIFASIVKPGGALLSGATSFGIALAAVGAGIAVVGAGLLIVAGAIAVIADAFSSDPIGPEVANVAKELNNLPNDVDMKINRIAGSVTNLSEAVDSFNFGSLISFSNIVDNIKELGNISVGGSVSLMSDIATTFNAIKETTPKQMEAASNTLDNIVKVSETNRENTIIKEISRIFSPKSNTQTTSNGNMSEIKLVLNDREFARAVIDTVNKQNNLRIV